MDGFDYLFECVRWYEGMVRNRLGDEEADAFRLIVSLAYGCGEEDGASGRTES